MTWSPEKRDKKRRRGTTLFNQGDEALSKDPTDTSLCLLCKGKQSLITCKDFLEKSVKERQDL